MNMSDVTLAVKKGYIYCLHDELNSICRIGQTTTTDQSRQNSQIAYYPFELKLYHFPAYNTNHAERYFHNYFNDKRTKADWFNISPEDFNALHPIYTKEYNLACEAKEYEKWEQIRKASKITPFNDQQIFYSLKLIEKGKKTKVITQHKKKWYVRANNKEVLCLYVKYRQASQSMFVIAEDSKFTVHFFLPTMYALAKQGEYANVEIRSKNRINVIQGYAIFK